MNAIDLKLDLSKEPKPIVVRIGQGDKAAPIVRAEILDHGQAFSLAGYTAKLEILTPSRELVEIAGAVSDNVATFALDGMEPGKTDVAYVQIAKGSIKASTQRFTIEVLEGSDR